jgi:hypothetical protein
MDDYYIAAERMWKDTNILKNNHRWFNTCYLSGYILECYGKLLIQNYTSKKPIDYKHNLKELNKTIQTEIALLEGASKYVLDFKTNCNTIYEGHEKWSPKKRYSAQKGVWDSEATADKFVNEAEKIMNLVVQMKIDGVI